MWMHVAPTKDGLKKHGLESDIEVKCSQKYEDVGGSGMVGVEGEEDGIEGVKRSDSKTVEQRYMERG
jgi:hypothetical protein